MKTAKALLCLIAVLEATRSTSGTTKEAFSGRSVKIDIKYESGYEENRKYLCKDPCTSNTDVLISANLRNVLVSAARYSLFDNPSTTVITATIHDLQLGDSGKYWIGVDIHQRVDSYKEFTLIVYPAPTTIQTTSTAAPSTPTLGTTPEATEETAPTTIQTTSTAAPSTPTLGTTPEATEETALTTIQTTSTAAPSTPTLGTSPEATEETGSPVPSAFSTASHVKDALPVGAIIGAVLGVLLLVILLVVLLLWMKKPKRKLTALQTKNFSSAGRRYEVDAMESKAQEMLPYDDDARIYANM
ncbi:CMRF35-like molecule 3 isoform X1 [Polypterus senegalus]|uniref:CMRF35-like molecule 3 isoform X1 n=1 Tax=Polypterus senegalus TaxID=55291 RepID=UPI001963315D|nr:CMRF35-like molecule 3 isoform X1 [Polypterus senegalus]